MRTEALVAILGMALVTYATRAGGFWLLGRVPVTPRVASWLRHLPGAILVALVAPAALAGGPAETVAALATAAVAARTGGVLPAMLCGIAAVWALRNVWGG